MTTMSKKAYFDFPDDIFDKYKNKYHRTIKVKPIHVKPGSYVEYNGYSNSKDAKFKVGDHIRISKYKNIFAKGYAPNWSEEDFVISKVKNTIVLTCIISDLICEEIDGTFYKKELQKTNEREFKVEKIIKRKSDKQYVRQKGYDNSFSSLIDKKDVEQEYKNKLYIELDLSNYVTIVDLKGARELDTSTLAAKFDLVSLKAEVDKIDKIKIKDYSC